MFFKKLLALTASMTFGLLPSHAVTLISVTDHGANPNTESDATPSFKKALAAAKDASKNGPVTLNIARGTYHFFSKDATRRPCFFSNSTEANSGGKRVIAIDIPPIPNLTINGNGSTLLMRGKMTMLVAEHCENLAIKGLIFDFKRPTFSEVTAVEKGDGFWIGKVHPDSSFRIINGKRIQWFGEDWENYHNLTQHYDPTNQTVWRGADPMGGATKITDTGNRTLRFDVPASSLQQVVSGHTYQFRNGNRDQCGMWFNRCQNVTMNHIKVRAMHGFGILAQFTENVSYSNMEVAPAPHSGRTCASPADILHFSGCKGLIRIDKCHLTAAHDDAMNVHGTHLRIVGQPSPDQLRLRFIHHQSWGFQAFMPGDQIELIRMDTLLRYASNRIKSVEMTDDPREQIITLHQSIADGIQLNSDAVENITWTPSVHVSNTVVEQIPTRGFLFTTRQPILVEKTKFLGTSMSAILLEDDARGWFESGPVHDLTLRDNLFQACSEPVIKINPENIKHGGPVHKNIKILNNTFVLRGRHLLTAKSTDGIKVDDNKITNIQGKKLKVKDVIHTRDTTHVTIDGRPL